MVRDPVSSVAHQTFKCQGAKVLLGIGLVDCNMALTRSGHYAKADETKEHVHAQNHEELEILFCTHWHVERGLIPRCDAEQHATSMM